MRGRFGGLLTPGNIRNIVDISVTIRWEDELPSVGLLERQRVARALHVGAPIDEKPTGRVWTREARHHRRGGLQDRAHNPNAHPIVSEIGAIMDAQRLGRKAASVRAGLMDSTVQSWFLRDARPRLPAVEAVANALGYRLGLNRVGALKPEMLGTKYRGGPVRYMNPETHPLVQELLRLSDNLGVSLRIVAGAAGVKYTTVKAWWAALGNQPALDRIDAMFRVFGLRVCLIPIENWAAPETPVGAVRRKRLNPLCTGAKGAVRETGVSRTTLWRWQKSGKVGSLRGLSDRAWEAKIANIRRLMLEADNRLGRSGGSRKLDWTYADLIS